jgi:NCS1 family nucleobase:cation symporter-1
MAPPANLTLGEKVKFAFSSPSNFHRALVLDSAAGKLINEDLVPSPPERQTWTAWDYFAYWWSEAWAVSTWSLGSSLVAVGVSDSNSGDGLSSDLVALRWRGHPRHSVC